MRCVDAIVSVHLYASGSVYMIGALSHRSVAVEFRVQNARYDSDQNEKQSDSQDDSQDDLVSFGQSSARLLVIGGRSVVSGCSR